MHFIYVVWLFGAYFFKPKYWILCNLYPGYNVKLLCSFIFSKSLQKHQGLLLQYLPHIIANFWCTICTAASIFHNLWVDALLGHYQNTNSILFLFDKMMSSMPCKCVHVCVSMHFLVCMCLCVCARTHNWMLNVVEGKRNRIGVFVNRNVTL